MPRRYTDQEKADALQRLADNFGSVRLTAVETGIPARTLREWKRQVKLNRNNAALPQKSAARQPEMAVNGSNDDDSPEEKPEMIPYEKAFTDLRSRLMGHVFNITESLQDDPYTIHLRVMALTRLLDRVIKLESLSEREQDRVIRIEFVDPDGSIHDTPIWQRNNPPDPDPGSTPHTAADADDRWPPYTEDDDHRWPPD